MEAEQAVMEGGKLMHAKGDWIQQDLKDVISPQAIQTPTSLDGVFGNVTGTNRNKSAYIPSALERVGELSAMSIVHGDHKDTKFHLCTPSNQSHVAVADDRAGVANKIRLHLAQALFHMHSYQRTNQGSKLNKYQDRAADAEHQAIVEDMVMTAHSFYLAQCSALDAEQKARSPPQKSEAPPVNRRRAQRVAHRAELRSKKQHRRMGDAAKPAPEVEKEGDGGKQADFFHLLQRVEAGRIQLR
jgi:hypothetical protein